MQKLKFIVLIVFIFFSQTNYAQVIRLTEDNKLNMEVFLMPGIDPQGKRLFQFSFVKHNHFEEQIRSDSLVLLTTSGKTLVLTDPIKNISHPSTESITSWNNSFALSPEYIAILKSEKISNLLIFINTKEKRIGISTSKSTEINDVVKKHF